MSWLSRLLGCDKVEAGEMAGGFAIQFMSHLSGPDWLERRQNSYEDILKRRGGRALPCSVSQLHADHAAAVAELNALPRSQGGYASEAASVESTESKCLAFIRELNERIIGGKYKLWSSQGILCLDVDLLREWVSYPSPHEIAFKPPEFATSVLAAGVPTTSKLFDRHGLEMPIVMTLPNFRDGYCQPGPLRWASPLRLSWSCLLDVARYCDRWDV